MLKQISCDKFIEKGTERPPIIFTKGLNSILGIGTKSNSIGKSTLLMIIDFCFGGEDYVRKETDTIVNIGHHTINFIFEFANTEYRFARKTDDSNIVLRYDKTSDSFNKISLNDFKQWLLEKYKLADLELTFREIVSRFFRIYNRQTHNELRPLNATVKADDKSGIVSLLKLMHEDENLQQLLTKVDELKNDKTTYDGLKRLNLGNVATTKNEFLDNSKNIEKLQNEIDTLLLENRLGALDINVVAIEQKQSLVNERKKLRSELSSLERTKQAIELNRELNPILLARNIEKLKQYFPNVIFNELEKIEKFHKDVQSIISSDIKDSNNEIDNLTAIIREKIKELDESIFELKNTPLVSNIVLQRHAHLLNQIQQLKDANANYQKLEETKNELKTKEAELNVSTAVRVKKLSDTINQKMAELNHLYFPGLNSPKLDINGLNSYQFFIPNDSGTGSRYRAVILFDMVVLKETSLPALAHDSVMITNIDEDKRNTIFEMYIAQKDKQIFTAYDISNVTSEPSKQILLDTSVIQLSQGDKALFGRQWNID